MRLIGVLGGMSPESTILYYRFMNEATQQATGDPAASARLVIHSVNFTELAALQRAGDWEGAGKMLADAARGLVAAGAELIIISANTMHIVAEQVRQSIGDRPLLHLGDVIVEQAGKGTRVLLTGTKYTMEMPFLSDYIKARDVAVETPDEERRIWIHAAIYEELSRGIVTPATKAGFTAILEQAKRDGFDAVVLGCTELGMLVDEKAPIRCIDTAREHARAAVQWALAETSNGKSNGT